MTHVPRDRHCEDLTAGETFTTTAHTVTGQVLFVGSFSQLHHIVAWSLADSGSDFRR